MPMPMPVRVELSLQDMQVAAHIGVMRRIQGMSKGQNRFGYSEDAPWETDIVGCQAELVVCRRYNLHWSGATPFGRDVGDIIDVRSIRSADRRLILHPSDPDEVPFVLVLRSHKYQPLFDLCGWVFAKDGKRDYPLKTLKENGEPAHYCDMLRPMSELDPWVEANRKPLKT